MNIPDLTNGILEVSGGILNIGHIKQILKDKELKGFSWPVLVFFITWGFWNLFYYPHLNQYLSFIGAITLIVTNLVWLSLIIKCRYYTKLRPRGD